MKLNDFLNRVEKYYKSSQKADFIELVIMYELLPSLRYCEDFLRVARETLKLIESQTRTSEKLIDNFPEYFKGKFVVSRSKNIEKDGYFIFLKDNGKIIFNISIDTLNEIKKILIKQGYTDEKNFYNTLKTNPIAILILFIDEAKEEINKRWNTLNKTLSKREIQKIEEIFKEKKTKQKENKAKAKDEYDFIEKFADDFIREIESFLNKA